MPISAPLRWYTSMPLTLFRLKTTNYANLRHKESPIFGPRTKCYPRNDERWNQNPLKQTALGLSLLPAISARSNFETCRHVFVFEKGGLIPGELVLYQIEPSHFSLEPAIPMELEGKIPTSARSLMNSLTDDFRAQHAFKNIYRQRTPFYKERILRKTSFGKDEEFKTLILIRLLTGFRSIDYFLSIFISIPLLVLNIDIMCNTYLSVHILPSIDEQM